MKEPTTLDPTFSCFDDALEFLDYVACSDDTPSNMLLVHAIKVNEEGKDYVHAWVEDPNLDVVIFAAIMEGQKVYLCTPRHQFYAAHPIRERTQYTMKEAFMQNLEHGNFGPWKPHYIALCANGARTIMGEAQLDCKLLGTLPTKKGK